MNIPPAGSPSGHRPALGSRGARTFVTLAEAADALVDQAARVLASRNVAYYAGKEAFPGLTALKREGVSPNFTSAESAAVFVRAVMAKFLANESADVQVMFLIRAVGCAIDASRPRTGTQCPADWASRHRAELAEISAAVVPLVPRRDAELDDLEQLAAMALSRAQAANRRGAFAGLFAATVFVAGVFTAIVKSDRHGPALGDLFQRTPETPTNSVPAITNRPAVDIFQIPAERK